MNIHPVGTEIFHADGRTDKRIVDTTKLLLALRNVANVPKNVRNTKEEELRTLQLRFDEKTLYLGKIEEFCLPDAITVT
jgi:uncharacterized protein (UPF0147 family)